MKIFFKILMSSELLLFVVLLSFTIKIYLLHILIPNGLRSLTIKHSWLFLLGTLIGTLSGDLAWIIKLIRELSYISIAYPTLVFFIRISWAFLVLQYQSLSFFLESLLTRRFSMKFRHKVTITCSLCISLYFIYTALFDTNLTDEATRNISMMQPLLSFKVPFEFKMMSAIIYYSFFCLMVPSIIITMHNSRRLTLPVIVNHQLSILLKYLIGSYLLVELLQMFNFMFTSRGSYLYPIVSISTVILSYAIYYSIKKVLGIRFLNFASHVQSKPNFDLIHDFKALLEQLSHVTSIQEVCQITQTFFKDAFDIPLRKAQLYLRMHQTEEITHPNTFNKVESLVENFLNTHSQEVYDYIKHSKILIYDELDFSNFFKTDKDRTILLTFLKSLNADIFLPIYDKNRMTAYIIVERHPRKRELYGNIERDEMIVFASYLGNIINLLQHRNLKSLIRQVKELNEELFSKHQEINHYKESIRSFMNNSGQKKIGIIFYKNHRFLFGNQAAKELIGVNLNTQSGHIITKACRKIVQQVTEYKSVQTMLANDEKGNKLVLSAVPNLEQNNIILIVHYPEISDIIIKQINVLQDPTKWDYLLHLETTKSGQLINQLIPSSGEVLLNFKIALLQTALSRKATLLEIPEEDLLPTVELLHHLSLREILHILTLEQSCKSNDIAVQLFGINPLFGREQTQTPLFKKLSENGTLFIKNIHFLNLETQEYLAEFIKFGFYRVFKSEQRIASNVRIICSTDQNLITLIQEGQFCKDLFNELKKTTLYMPSLQTLPVEELNMLADGLTEQAIKTADFKSLLGLNEKDKMRLAHNRPVSFQELRVKVESLLVKKSKKNNIFHETYFDPAYHIADPELSEAARLGKQALRDPKIMSLLWNKFQNQNKIATFLGVNRSSVNRRCKQYNLH